MGMESILSGSVPQESTDLSAVNIYICAYIINTFCRSYELSYYVIPRVTSMYGLALS